MFLGDADSFLSGEEEYVSIVFIQETVNSIQNIFEEIFEIQWMAVNLNSSVSMILWLVSLIVLLVVAKFDINQWIIFWVFGNAVFILGKLTSAESMSEFATFYQD